MITMSKIKSYQPENPKFGTGWYLKDDQGRDFYESAGLFQTETGKLMVAEDGQVIGYSRDVTSLFPVDSTLIEIDHEKVPVDVMENSKYSFNIKNGEFNIRPEYNTLQLEAAKKRLLVIANDKVEDLSDRIVSGETNEDVAEELVAWKTFRVSVRKSESLSELPKLPN